MSLVIVIEDHFPNARMAEKLLTRAGHKVILAEDGEGGLTAIFENQPDLVLIDLGLPDIDGQTVIGLVKQQDNLKHVPMIAFTAWPPEEAHDMAHRYGCDGVITKPINTRTFADELSAYIKTKDDDEATVTDKQAEETTASGTDAKTETVHTETAEKAKEVKTEQNKSARITDDSLTNIGD